MSERTELTPEGSRFRLPTEPQVMLVTPDMASDWLSYRNHPKNRPLSKSVAGKYQADMEAVPSRWRETPEPMIFDTEGYIISAQHRLKAVANSGIAQRFWVVPDQSRDIFDVVDQGYKRSAAHVLRIPFATSGANGARFLAALADGEGRTLRYYNRSTIPEIVRTFRAWPELAWFSTETYAVYRAARIPAGAHLAVLAQVARTEHYEQVTTWLDDLKSGAGLAGGDSRLLLREKFRGGLVVPPGVSQHELHYALITKAWNAYAASQELGMLRWRRDEPLPRVLDAP